MDGSTINLLNDPTPTLTIEPQ